MDKAENSEAARQGFESFTAAAETRSGRPGSVRLFGVDQDRRRGLYLSGVPLVGAVAWGGQLGRVSCVLGSGSGGSWMDGMDIGIQEGYL